jgi:hypothetical protein
VLNWASRYEGLLGEWRYSSTHCLTPALDGGERSASRPGRFIPRKRAPCTHWVGGWVGLRAVLDAMVKRKIPSPLRESNPRTPIVQPVAQRYTDWAIAAFTWQGRGMNLLLSLESRFTCQDHYPPTSCLVTRNLECPPTRPVSTSEKFIFTSWFSRHFQLYISVSNVIFLFV